MVPEIEEISPEHEFVAFLELERLNDREVPILLGGTSENVPWRIAEILHAGSSRVGDW